jgi:hypothetical protein
MGTNETPESRPVAPAARYLLREYERADRVAAEAIRYGWEVELAHARGRQEMAQDALFQLFNIDDPESLIPGMQAAD